MKMPTFRHSRLTRAAAAFAIAAAAVCTAPALQASLIFFEDFDYTPGSTLHGQSGGTGSATGTGSGWVINGNNNLATISGTGLNYQFANGDTLSSDQSVRVQGVGSTTAIRDFATIKLDATHNVTEVYVSFLASSTTWTTSGTIGLGVGSTLGTFDYQTVVSGTGPAGDRWATTVAGGSAGNAATDDLPPLFIGTETNETHLIVVRFFKDGTSTVFNKAELWVDPTSTTQGSPDAVALRNSYNTSAILYLGIINKNTNPTADYNFGRIVAGTSWDDVVSPIPEPGTVSLVFAAGALIVGTRHMRRRSRQSSHRS